MARRLMSIFLALCATLGVSDGDDPRARRVARSVIMQAIAGTPLDAIEEKALAALKDEL